MASCGPGEPPEDRDAAIRRYRELLAEKEALARSIAWLRSQLPVEPDPSAPTGSDLLFLADYACKERHIAVRGLADLAVADAAPLELTVQQRMEKMSAVVWPSSCVLAEVVACELRDICQDGSPVLELGCGTALPSLVAAALGAEALATDAEVAAAELVIARNRDAITQGSVTTACIRWGDRVPERPWGAVLASDCIYDEDWHAPLAATLASAADAALASGSQKRVRILVAYQDRRPEVEQRFLRDRLREVGLQASELPLDAVPLSEKLRSCVHVADVTPLASGAEAVGSIHL